MADGFIEIGSEEWVKSLHPNDTVEKARTLLLASQAISLKRLADEALVQRRAVRAITSELADLDDLDRNNLNVKDVRDMLERILAEITG